jgi:hypothetical protein
MKRLVVAMALVLAVSCAASADARRTKPRKCLSGNVCHTFGARLAQPSRAPVSMTGARPHAPLVGPPANEAPAPTTSTPTPTPPAPATARLGVTAREWSLVLSRSVLPAGRALVELQNFGEDAHNLRLERIDGSGARLDVPLAESGERQRAQGTLDAGDYKVYCALPGHDAQGMHARLTVTP